MRVIKFRGRCVSTDKWVYGGLYQQHDGVYIMRRYADGYIDLEKVDPETVGQYTGLKDKNGREIYEGDIIKCFREYNAKVVFKHGCFCLEGLNFGKITAFCDIYGEMEIIGNIYENPELLEGIEYEK